MLNDFSNYQVNISDKLQNKQPKYWQPVFTMVKTSIITHLTLTYNFGQFTALTQKMQLMEFIERNFMSNSPLNLGITAQSYGGIHDGQQHAKLKIDTKLWELLD